MNQINGFILKALVVTMQSVFMGDFKSSVRRKTYFPLEVNDLSLLSLTLVD